MKIKLNKTNKDNITPLFLALNVLLKCPKMYWLPVKQVVVVKWKCRFKINTSVPVLCILVKVNSNTNSMIWIPNVSTTFKMHWSLSVAETLSQSGEPKGYEMGWTDALAAWSNRNVHNDNTIYKAWGILFCTIKQRIWVLSDATLDYSGQRHYLDDPSICLVIFKYLNFNMECQRLYLDFVFIL